MCTINKLLNTITYQMMYLGSNANLYLPNESNKGSLEPSSNLHLAKPDHRLVSTHGTRWKPNALNP